MEDTVYELFSVDKAPKVLKPYPPEYPLSAIVSNISRGRVVARFVVTKEGKTKNISIIESDPPGVFDENALAAIRKYRFTPGYNNGIPVNVIIDLPIIFEIKDKSP